MDREALTVRQAQERTGIAAAEGMETMRIDGLKKALVGVTSIADVLRATQAS